MLLIAGNWQRGAGRIARYGSVGGRGTRAVQGEKGFDSCARACRECRDAVTAQGPAAAQRRGR